MTYINGMAVANNSHKDHPPGGSGLCFYWLYPPCNIQYFEDELNEESHLIPQDFSVLKSLFIFPVFRARNPAGLQCSVYFFAGAKDFNTNHNITCEYFNKISAPKKYLFLFENAGHAPPETHAELFQKTRALR